MIWIQVPRSLLYRRLTSSTRAAYPRSAVEANAVSTRRGIGVFVLAAAITGWNCGNVGPVVGLGATLAKKIRVLQGIWACCVLSIVAT